ncbi:MAG: hypothetical protein ACE3JK_15765 [Sporolactobacillus sp.]
MKKPDRHEGNLSGIKHYFLLLFMQRRFQEEDLERKSTAPIARPEWDTPQREAGSLNFGYAILSPLHQMRPSRFSDEFLEDYDETNNPSVGSSVPKVSSEYRGNKLGGQ